MLELLEIPARDVAVYGSVIVLALLELWRPRRRLHIDLVTRWTTNIALAVSSVLLYRLSLPLSGLLVAEFSAGEFGLLRALSDERALQVLAALLALDLWKYVEHRLLHAIGPLWRLHLVHHADTDVDFTTAERHHPLEAAALLPVLPVLVLLLGIPAEALVLYAVLGTVSALVTHANLGLPERLDRALRLLVVTPGMHIVHHSAERRETDSNFGSVLSVWDRLFGTYRDTDAARDAARTIGLESFRTPRQHRLDRALALPFLRPDAPAAEGPARDGAPGGAMAAE